MGELDCGLPHTYFLDIEQERGFSQERSSSLKLTLTSNKYSYKLMM